MHRFLSGLLHGAHLPAQEAARIRAEATSESLGRLHKLAALFALINLGYLYYFWWVLPTSASPALGNYHRAIATIHGISAVVVAALWPWLHWLCRTPGAHPRAQTWARGLLGGWALAFGIALSVADQWVSNNTTNYTMACLFVAMVWLLHPVTALLLLGVAYAALHPLLAWSQADAQLLSMARNHAFASTLLCVVIAGMMWRQFVQAALLRHALSRSNEALERKREELSYLAHHDALTGLLNRRAFLQDAQHELQRAQRYGTPTGLLIADLDHFKATNDRHGHPAGDAVLCAFAAILKAQLRDSDLAARLGGEEFIVLLPASTREGTLAAAEKIRQAMAQHTVRHSGQELRATVSLGAANAPPGPGSDVESLYAQADRALYAAKARGRNRVVHHDELE